MNFVCHGGREIGFAPKAKEMQRKMVSVQCDVV